MGAFWQNKHTDDGVLLQKFVIQPQNLIPGQCLILWVIVLLIFSEMIHKLGEGLWNFLLFFVDLVVADVHFNL
jgi:hypothetical protein